MRCSPRLRDLSRRLTQPWSLHRLRDGDAEVTLVWRNRLPAIIILALLAIDLISPARAWKTLLLAFASVTVVALWWAWHMHRAVRVRREVQFQWIQAGDVLEEHFTLVNDSPLPVLWAEVSDQGDVPGYSAATVRAVGPHSVYHWNTSGECHIRGEYHLGPWEATTNDPFGLFAVVQRNPKAQTVLVYPPIARQLPFALPRGAAAGRARISDRSWEPTVSVGGVRTYVPGDPRRHIHWPTSARRDQLHVKEFDQETGGDIWLVPDLDRDVQVGHGERSTEEMGIILAASVAALLLDTGRAVGLIAYGPQRTMVMPARGRGHLWSLLRVLAQVQAVQSRPLSHVLDEVAHMLHVGATALVITPSLDPAWISGLTRPQAHGIGVAAVVLDAASFAEGASDDRLSAQAQGLRALLADARVDAEIVHADTPLSLRPPTGQVRRWEFKVLGTGRAVAVSKPWGVQEPWPG